jgi:hypothetical protein
MKKIYLSLIVIILSFSLFAQNETIIKTNDFSKIRVNQPLDIYLHQSDSSYIKLVGNDLDPGKIAVNRKNESLSLDVRGPGNLSSKIHIYSKKFTEISMSSASDLHTVGQLQGETLSISLTGASDAKISLNYRTLSVTLSGASDLSIYGQADTMVLFISGASDFDSYGTKNTYTFVQGSGSSDINVNPDSNLVAKIGGASELRYKTEPAHKSIEASGSSEYGQKSNDKEIVEYNNMSVEEDGDTTRINLGNGRTRIIIIDGDDGVSIRSQRESRLRFRGNWAGLELGINGYLTPEGSINLPKEYEFMELKYEKSTNFNFNFFQQSVNLAGNHFGLVTGLGFRWNNYRFSNNVVLVPDSATIYGYHNTDSLRSYSKSKLTVWYLTLPVLLEFQTNSFHNTKSFHIGVGVIGGLRMRTHTKQKYTSTGGGEHKPKTYDDFHLQPFTLDATVRIGWGPINLYGTYSIIEMFRKDHGPKLHPFMVGIILPFT